MFADHFQMTGRASRAIRRLALARERSGLRGLAAEVIRLARRVAVLPVLMAVELIFDLRMGVRTRGLLSNEADLLPLAIGRDPVHYDPTELLPWRQLQSAIPVDRSSTTFIDLGAGRGRAVILAAEEGFRRVVGVELDERLVKQAEENVRRWRSRRRKRQRPGQEVVIIQGDAAAYPLPDGPVLIWLYNPFGAATLRYVLRQVCTRSPASTDPVFIAYFNPVHESVFDEFPDLVLSSRGKRWATYRLATESVTNESSARVPSE
jgi:SAM-dependent methyltransferase